MQSLSHNAGSIGIGGQITANGSRGLATGTAAAVGVSVLAPAGSDEVSVLASAAFMAEGVQTLGINALAQEEIARAGAAIIQIAGVYQAVDGENGGTLI